MARVLLGPAIVLAVLASGVAPVSAAVAPQVVDFGDVPYGTAGTPEQSVAIDGGEHRVKSIFGAGRFRVVSEDCEEWVDTSCTMWIAPFWPLPGDAVAAGRSTQAVVVTYTNGRTEHVYVSANFLPPPPPPPPSSWFSIENTTLYEGNTGTRTANLLVRRWGNRTAPASVRWSTQNDTAGAGSDYVAVPPTTLNFAANEAAKTVSVTVQSDTLSEGDEWFLVRLSSPVGAEVSSGDGDDVASATILDDDATSNVSVNDVSTLEGDSGSRTLSFTVRRSGNVANPGSVGWTTANGSALAGTDYVAAPVSTLAFAASESAKIVAVTVTSDRADEGDETFLVRLSAPVGVVLSDDTGVGTIVDDDETYLAIGDVTRLEGSTGTTEFTFTVTRSGDTVAASSVRWATANGTAAAGADYTAVAATTLDFAANERSKTVSVLVQGDATDEANETFSVRLTNAEGAVLSDDTGVATIVDDDGPVTPGPSTYLTIADKAVVEGASGTRQATFAVTRSGDVSAQSSVKWSTADASAAAGSDYGGVALTDLLFAANERTKLVSVPVNGDGLDELHETFSVRLSSAVGAAVSDAIGVGTITDDDATFLSVNDIRVSEGDSGASNATFTITRSGSLSAASSVQWSTTNGTAVAGSDYTFVPLTTVNFDPGQATKTVHVPVLGDTVDERNETFSVVLSRATNASISDSRGTATLADNDAATFVGVTDVSVVEGSSGTQTATFTAYRYGRTTIPTSVRWATWALGTATAGSDYVAVPATEITFAPNQTRQTVSVSVNSDGVDEDDETFLVRLSSPVGAAISDEVGKATIVDDDPTTALVINDVIAFPEEAAGTLKAEFTITRSGNTSGTSTVQWSTADGTALAGSDYQAVAPTTVSFGPNQTTVRIQATVIDDAVDEENESFSVNLSSAAGATILDGSGRATITDNSIDPDS